jgi:GTP cyclohydrolase IA
VAADVRAFEEDLELSHVPAIDVPAATEAARAFLEALGVDLARDGMAETPARMARAYAELLAPRSFRATTFVNDGGYNQLVLLNDIPVRSLCEHHMLGFIGVAHVGYLPKDRILELSKLARLVEYFALRQPQVQERLTEQIVDWLATTLAPRGAGAVVEAEHLCMTMRGVQAPGTRAITSALRGVLLDEVRTRVEFFSLTGVAH